MARYFFDLINGAGTNRDLEGQDMTSPEEISREVSRILADIAQEEFPGRDGGMISVEVRDEQGRPVLAGHLSFRTHWYP
ncbi:DUF6894 family protein [Rhizobium puerariae]|uniref:DUF6894 family protein n=1 Tax=Rhizobium puerariae TaxID=1585791 RepID=A0ABV6AJP6_9HYPH